MAALETIIYIGGYAPATDAGIRVFRLNEEAGTLTLAGGLVGVANPSFLAASPQGRTLYAACEIGSFAGRDGVGAVAAVTVGEDGTTLELLGQQSSEGSGPCHVAVTPDGTSVLVANYGGGTVARLPLGGEGEALPATDSVVHEGASHANPNRQERCHAHSFTPHPSGKFAVACDLGADRLFIYRLAADGKLLPSNPTATHPGAGPRHLDFSADGRFAYVVNELDNTVVVYTVDADAATLTEAQVIGTLPEGFTGGNTTAEVCLHPNGRFLYASNRGHHSIAAFAVDTQSGLLTALGHTPTGGKTPRNFALAPSGRWLIAANQDSDSLTVFAVDPDTGALTPTGEPISTPKPTAVLFVG